MAFQVVRREWVGGAGGKGAGPGEGGRCADKPVLKGSSANLY